MRNKGLILVSLLLAAFAINLDTTIVNVALPTLVRELHCLEQPAAVDRRRLQPRVRRVPARRRQPLATASGARACCSPASRVFGLASVAGGLIDEPPAS